MNINDPLFLEAIDRTLAGNGHFGDAGLIVLAIDDHCCDNDVSVSYVEMILEIPAGTFERLDEIAMRAKFGPRP